MQNYNIALSKLKSYIPLKKTAFICCASFEQRCFSIAKSLSNYEFSNVFIVRNTDFEYVIKENLTILESCFHTESISHVQINTQDPLATADKLHSVFLEISREKYEQVVIDISTFTHESVLLLYKLACNIMAEEINILFVYNTAQYHEDIEGHWLSKGCKQIRSVVGFPGEMEFGQKLHLTVIVGFEAERVIELISDYEPDYISLGCGNKESSVTPSCYDVNTKCLEAIRKIFGSSTGYDFFELPLNDFHGCVSGLLGAVNSRKDTNRIIAPLNNKISTLAAAKLANDDPTIQLTYTQPERYNISDYSEPGDVAHIINLEVKSAK